MVRSDAADAGAAITGNGFVLMLPPRPGRDLHGAPSACASLEGWRSSRPADRLTSRTPCASSVERRHCCAGMPYSAALSEKRAPVTALLQISGMTRRDKLRRAQPSCPAPGVKFRLAQFHIMASQPPCVGRKLRPQQAGYIARGIGDVSRGRSWPLSGPSEPPCRTAAIDRSCTTCAARGRSGSSVTADKPVRVKASRSAWPVPCETAAGRSGI